MRRPAANNSMLFASQIVQVTTDAKARPIITAFTTMSAWRNIPQAEKSVGKSPAPVITGAIGAGGIGGDEIGGDEIGAGALAPSAV